VEDCRPEIGVRVVLSRIWHRVVSAQPAPPAGVIAAAAVVAFLLVVVPGLWRRSRHLVTVAHEAAHAIAALATGRRLSGIRLHADTSGLTLSRGRRSGPGMIVTAAAGYVGPALLGLGAAYLLSIRHAVALLWLVLVALVLLLTVIRNWFGLWSVLVAAVVVFAVSWWGSGTAQAACAYVGAWFLLFAAPRPVLELQTSRRRGAARDSDADTLARLTGVPGLVWVGVFLLVTVAALAVGTRLLLAGAAKN
jgi:hypothetical protein